jgi:hypothetical protein
VRHCCEVFAVVELYLMRMENVLGVEELRKLAMHWSKLCPVGCGEKVVLFETR